jgi:hypothetical protein
MGVTHALEAIAHRGGLLQKIYPLPLAQDFKGADQQVTYRGRFSDNLIQFLTLR